MKDLPRVDRIQENKEWKVSRISNRYQILMQCYNCFFKIAKSLFKSRFPNESLFMYNYVTLEENLNVELEVIITVCKV